MATAMLTATEVAHIITVQLGVLFDEIREERRIPSTQRERWTTLGSLIQNYTAQLREDLDPATAEAAGHAQAPAKPHPLPTIDPGTNIVRLFPTMSTPTEASTGSGLTPDPQPA